MNPSRILVTSLLTDNKETSQKKSPVSFRILVIGYFYTQITLLGERQKQAGYQRVLNDGGCFCVLVGLLVLFLPNLDFSNMILSIYPDKKGLYIKYPVVLTYAPASTPSPASSASSQGWKMQERDSRFNLANSFSNRKDNEACRPIWL